MSPRGGGRGGAAGERERRFGAGVPYCFESRHLRDTIAGAARAKTTEDALARAARAEAALADDDTADRCAAAEARAARAEADAAERARRADRAEAALAASRGAAADAAQAAAALADDAAGFTQRVSKIVDGARDACADGLVEGALSAARLSLAREGAGADAVEAIEAAARRDAEAAARRDAEVAARREAEAEQRRNAEALSAARAEAELRRQSSEQHKDECKELRQTVRDLKGTIGTQRAYIRANDDADDLRLQLRKLQRALDVAEAKASKTDQLEVRLQDLQNELDAHKAQGEVFAVDATRLSVCPPVPPPLPPRPQSVNVTLADGAVVPASTVAPAAPTVASDFDAELLGACRKHHLTGRWRVVARRLKLWRIVQTAHALREHCDAPTPVASPVAEEPVASPARTEELEPAAEPSPASTEEAPSPAKTEPSSQPLSLSAWASAAPSLPKTPPADRDGALGALDAWASRRSPEPAASTSPELALGAFSSRKSLESPTRSPSKPAPTSPLAAFMAKVPNPTSPALSPRSQQKSPSKLAAFVAAVPNPQSPRAPSPPLSSRLRSSAGANRKRSKTPGSRKTPIKTRENSPPPRRSPRRSPRFQRSG